VSKTRTLLVLWTGILGCSTATVLLKASHIDAASLSALRLLVAAILLTPVFLRDWRRHRAAYSARHLARSIAPGILFGLHFIAIAAAVRRSLVANVALLLNLLPALLPFFSWAILRERVTRAEARGTALALVGVAVLFATGARPGANTLAGDGIGFLGMALFAWYFALGRLNRSAPTIWLYVAPLYWIAALVCLPFGLVHVQPDAVNWAREIPIILALGLVPTIMGHASLLAAVRHLSAQTVSLTNLSQFAASAVLAWFALGEAPGWNFYVAAIPLIAGAAVAIRALDRAGQPPMIARAP